MKFPALVLFFLAGSVPAEAAPPAAPDGAPVRRTHTLLPPIWSVSAYGVVGLTRNHVVVHGFKAGALFHAVHHGATGRATSDLGGRWSRFSPSRVRPRDRVIPTLVVADQGIVAAAGRSEILVIDPATGKDRWFLRRPGTITPLPSRAQRLPGAALFENAGLTAHDLRTGRTLWRQPKVTGRIERAQATATRLLLPDATHGVMGLDLSTGRLVYRLPAREGDCLSRRLLASEDLVLGLCDREVHVFRSSDGRALGRWPNPPGLDPERTRLSGTLLVAPMARGSLVGLDARTGRSRWRRPLPVEEIAASGADGIWACSRGGVLHRLDPATGKSLWRWSLGSCGEGLAHGQLLHPAPGRHPLEVVAVDLDQHRALAFSRAAVALEPGASPRILRQEPVLVSGTVRVNGRPRAGLRVFVGDFATQTDAGGRYRARVHLAGRIRVAVDLAQSKRLTGRPCGPVQPAVRSTSLGLRQLTIDVEQRLFPSDPACGQCRCE